MQLIRRPQEVSTYLNFGRLYSFDVQKKVCTMAQQKPAGPSLSEVLSASTAIPTAAPVKHARGSVFDTLEGNVLER
jgi:hypothetical protein